MTKVSQEQARDILLCHQQIDAAIKMKDEILESIANSKSDPEFPFNDVFGRPAKMELSIPSSRSSSRIVRVEHRMVLPILDVVIAERKAELKKLNKEIFAEKERSND